MKRKIKKSDIVADIRRTFRSLYLDKSLNDPGQCLRWAAATCVTLKTYGIWAIPAGGSMSWQIVPPELDDGVSATHFSYEFEPGHPLSQFSMARGDLPEMHVWAYLPETDEIVDVTTRHLKAQFARMAPNIVWRAPDPPPYLWARADALPDGCSFRPDLDATAIAHVAIRQLKLLHRPGGPSPK